MIGSTADGKVFQVRQEEAKLTVSHHEKREETEQMRPQPIPWVLAGALALVVLVLAKLIWR